MSSLLVLLERLGTFFQKVGNVLHLPTGLILAIALLPLVFLILGLIGVFRGRRRPGWVLVTVAGSGQLLGEFAVLRGLGGLWHLTARGPAGDYDPSRAQVLLDRWLSLGFWACALGLFFLAMAVVYFWITDRGGAARSA